jgi:polyisoprenoid-binding protein YceI
MMQNQKWVIDYSHSKIGFSVRHFGITETEGLFRKFDGKVYNGQDDFSDLAVDIIIDVRSIDTNDAQRDGHLLSADFFDVENFPTIQFRSTKTEKVSNDNFLLIGDLTIKGISKVISLNVAFAGIVPKDPFGNTKAGFFVDGKIDRKDFDIKWNAALDHGGVAVSDTVKLNIPMQLLKQ